MRDFPSCFGENGVQIADSSCSNKPSHNSCSNIYRSKLFGKSCLIAIVWSKNLMGQCLSIEIDDSSHQCMCKFDVKPSLFSKRKGSKILQINSNKMEVFWDLSAAKFGPGPEPVEGYYIAIVLKGEVILFLGDMKKEALKKTGAIASIYTPILISKKEHIYGKRVYCTKAQFHEKGRVHDLKIEWDDSSNDDPSLSIRVDAKIAMQVKHLQWKFRGNHTILVDGMPVEVFWDVHNWLFCPSSGNGVFVFQTCLCAEKMWGGSSPSLPDSTGFSWGCSESLRGGGDMSGLGFSFLLFAWKND